MVIIFLKHILRMKKNWNDLQTFMETIQIKDEKDDDNIMSLIRQATKYLRRKSSMDEDLIRQ